ncbi:MAG: nickel-dependent lactate racemase [Planctomycetes bacterium]|nr:nickel-dependent lactate racemase [Planctomycetota bacterium]
MEFSLHWGKTTLPARIEDASLQGVLLPNPMGERPDAATLIATALANPIGSPRLADIVRPGETVAIVTSDITRPFPGAVVLPQVVDELSRAGIADADMVIVFALGIHRGHSEGEKRALVGDALYDRIRCVDSDPNRVVAVGTTSGNGTPVRIFAEVAQADRRVCLGNIEYHYFAGYSGGGKAIMPGVSTREAIQANHSLMVDPGARAGALADNPVRQDIDEAAGLVGVDFILNVVLDETKAIVAAVAGDYLAAHRAGARALDSLYKVPIDRRADIVLVSAGGFPKDINLYQAQKALDNARQAVRDGGIIILVASCREGLGEDVFERWMTGAASSGAMIRDIRNRFELGGHKAAAIAMVLERARVFLVSDLTPEFVRNIFLEPFPDIDAALEEAFAALGPTAQVLVMPYGGSTLPWLSET